MATDLVGNEKLQRFIRLLSDLNHEIAEVFDTGRTEVFERMNKTVEEMYAIQHTGEEEAYTAIEEDCQIIYKNFDAIVAMLQSNESLFFDNATNAVREAYGLGGPGSCRGKRRLRKNFPARAKHCARFSLMRSLFPSPIERGGKRV